MRLPFLTAVIITFGNTVMGYLRFKFCVLEVVDCAKFELTTLQMNIFAKTKKVGKLSLACFERTRVECFKQYMGGGVVNIASHCPFNGSMASHSLF